MSEGLLAIITGIMLWYVVWGFIILKTINRATKVLESIHKTIWDLHYMWWSKR